MSILKAIIDKDFFSMLVRSGGASDILLRTAQPPSIFHNLYEAKLKYNPHHWHEEVIMYIK